VQISDNAVIQDLHGANFTAEAWVRADGYSATNAGIIFDKTDALPQGWQFYIYNAANIGLAAEAHYAGAGVAYSGSGLDDFHADSLWHHVAVTLIYSTRIFRLWVDGVEVSYVTQQSGGAGAATTDVGNDLYIGNWLTGNASWDGDIGWCRISDTLRYNTVNFEPPPRCELPAIDGNTIGQWIGAESSGATIDNQEGTVAIDGTQTNCTFGSECDLLVGRNETCSDEVYIANKHNRSQLTHVFVDDGGVFGANLLDAVLPYNLLPAVPVANDAIYFGVTNAMTDTGPFCSLVFDIQTAVTGVTSAAWEYWNGAWIQFGAGVSQDVQDNTDNAGVGGGAPFDTVGVGSVHWEPPSDWTTTAVNAVTGWWVRMRVAAAAGATAPVQQNRHVYTILWPYVDVEDDQIGGDVEAFVRLLLVNQSDHAIGASGLEAWANRVVVGSRSISRGVNFDAYINLSDEQNESGIVVDDLGGGAFANDVQAPTGRLLRLTNPGARGNVCSIEIGIGLAYQYDGVYHMFLRGQQTSGSAGDIDLDITAGFGNIHGDEAIFYESETVAFYATTDWALLDFGRIEIRSRHASTRSGGIFFTIYATGDGAADADLYDLILMPVDEYAGDYVTANNVRASRIGARGLLSLQRQLDVDNILNPKNFAALVEHPALGFISRYLSVGAPATLQANADQRIWFMTARYDSLSNENESSEQFVSETVQMWAVNRYLSQRGNR
jgi:hypothetical protein